MEFAEALSGAERFYRAKWPARRIAVMAAAAVLLAVVTILVVLRSHDDAETARPLDPNVIAVMPWRVRSADPTLRTLRMGMAHYFHLALSGSNIQLAVYDPIALESSWNHAGGGPETDLTRDQEVALARQVGAGYIANGAVMRSGNSLSLTASLVQVGTGEVVTASTVGVHDSLPAMAQELIWNLLAELEGDIPEGVLAQTPPAAIEAYLAALDVYWREVRRGRRDSIAMFLVEALDIEIT